MGMPGKRIPMSSMLTLYLCFKPLNEGERRRSHYVFPNLVFLYTQDRNHIVLHDVRVPHEAMAIQTHSIGDQRNGD
ncbi:hypothetical protein F4804DRAFT_324057 [Jackrogersella minutella]|nr:hypothetical protein F4804DRAFT_324057 [Jackrogersella minutella]